MDSFGQTNLNPTQPKNMRCPEAAARVLCVDTAYFAAIAKKRPQANAHPKAAKTGRAIRRGSRGVKGVAAKLPPSIVQDFKQLAADRRGSVGVMTSAQVVSGLHETHSAFAQALSATHRTDSAVDTFVPLSTVEHDNTQLMWNRKDGSALCSANHACDATHLKHSQGPLNAYLLPGQAPETGTLCLLCLRLHSELLNAELNAIDPAGLVLSLMPPFTNLVNVPGGYCEWALGVTPGNHRVFDRQCAIVGSSPYLQARYSVHDDQWWVDQSQIVWTPGKDFRQGAQEK